MFQERRGDEEEEDELDGVKKGNILLVGEDVSSPTEPSHTYESDQSRRPTFCCYAH